MTATNDKVEDFDIKQANATILCVEDEPDLLEILAEELEEAGYAVVQAANGKLALEFLQSRSPDLILCDVAMPGMDGYELLRLIRETRPDLSDVPFVFLSAQDGSGQIVHGKHAGADDYLVKPVNFDLMLATIAARIRQVQRVRNSLSASRSHGHTLLTHEAVARKVFHNMARTFNLVSSGIVLLDRRGSVVFANAAALRLGIDSVCPDLARMLASRAGESAVVPSAAVKAAIEAGMSGNEHVDFLSLDRVDGQRDLLVTVCSLVDETTEHDAPAAALFICSGPRNEPAPLKALEALFKLTPAEGRIAWAFAQGLKPDEIAAAFDVSITTVAFHKRNIFQKTHTNRQADLIALLLTLPVSIELD